MAQIEVKGLGKAFKTYGSMSKKLINWLLPGGYCAPQLQWVLKDINFTVDAGECVGLVGVNGAGKSTLLKIIAGTMRPTAGDLQVRGRVAALLELGMGFHPDFTGRQNAAMGAQLYGYSAEELKELMPVIEDFAEIGAYIDKPLRTYSSGMHMRLAFSVATARRPDVLIVDEALAVGDSYFQHKSFERIKQFREAGTTLLIVSHNPAAIQSICDRAIMLEQGELIHQGRPDEVLDYYNAMLADRTRGLIAMEKLPDGTTRTISGTKDVSIESVHLRSYLGQRTEILSVGEKATLEVEAVAKRFVETLVLGFLIKDNLGQAIYGINTYRLKQVLKDVSAGTRIKFSFSFPANLGKGSFSVSLSLSRSDSHLDGNYEWIDRALIFHMINSDKEDFVGCSWLGAESSVEIVEPNTDRPRSAASGESV